MDKNNTSITTEHGKARRGFVKKSSAIAGISILPASNVWGTCNVSGVSGGSQQVNTTCTVRSFSGGYWPSFWEHFVQNRPSEENLSTFATLIIDVSNTETFNRPPKKNKIEYYYPKVSQLLYMHNINLPSFGNHTPALSLNVGDAMKRRSLGDKRRHLAAVYINHLFGFANVEHQFRGHDGRGAYMEHIWGSFHEGNFWDTTNTLKASYDSFGKLSEESLKKMLRKHGIPT